MSAQTKYVSYAPAGSPAWTPSRNPNWCGGWRDGWRHAKSVHAVDFQNNRGMNGLANAPLASCLSVTRTSAHYLLDNSDHYQFCDVNALALRPNVGAYIGGAFTNKIRNPRGEGGTSGLIGSGGVVPTNWLCEQAGINFNYTLIVGQSESGLPATDIRIENLGNTSRRIIFEQGNMQIAALPGEAWGFDVFVKLQAGSLASTTLALELQWRDSGGGGARHVYNGYDCADE